MLLLEADLDLSSLLERMAQEACGLVGARYGAMGVLNAERDGLAEFITVGLDTEVAHRIGELPTGQGILGPADLRAASAAAGRHRDPPRPLRLPGQPPDMHSFLGVSVKVRDAIYGNLYLTEKIGAAEFTKDDEVMVTALAASAGSPSRTPSFTSGSNSWPSSTSVNGSHGTCTTRHPTVVRGGPVAPGHAAGRIVDRIGKRLEKAVSDIDETIRQIRSTIFELTTATMGRGSAPMWWNWCDELDEVIGFEVG